LLVAVMVFGCSTEKERPSGPSPTKDAKATEQKQSPEAAAAQPGTSQKAELDVALNVQAGFLLTSHEELSPGYPRTEIDVKVNVERCPLVGSHYTCALGGLPVGTYRLAFKQHDGFDAPQGIPDLQLSTAGLTVLREYRLTGDPDSGDLNVGLNLREAGFRLTSKAEKAGGGPLVKMDVDVAECTPVGSHYTCGLGLATGVYKLEFKPVEGYDTPKGIDDIELTSKGKTVLREYQRTGFPSAGTLDVGLNLRWGGFVVTSLEEDAPDVPHTRREVDAASCPLVGLYYTCSLKLRVGKYKVEFRPVAGFGLPESYPEVKVTSQGTTVRRLYPPAVSREG
jgi:hypothetical protein